MNISSKVFENSDKVPAKHTCDGENINPPFQIEGVPEGAESLVLIMDDPDSPSGTWVHWTVWNIDPNTTEIGENSVPTGAVEGTTTFGENGYGGPCPGSGEHHYVFKLYALDTKLDLPPQTQKPLLEEAMQGHILAEARLVGLYERG